MAIIDLSQSKIPPPENPLKREFDRKEAEVRFNVLWDEHNLWVPKWREIRDFLQPWRGVFPGDKPKSAYRKDAKLYDGTGFDAVSVLAAGIMYGLTPRSRPWYRLGLEDPDLSEYAPVRTYLDKAQEVLYAGFAKSNIYNCFHSMYSEIGPFGTGCMSMLPDYHNLYHCKTFTTGTYAVGVDARGGVNQFARKMKMTPMQMAEQFGYAALDRETKKKVDKRDTKSEVDVCHFVEPNYEQIVGSPWSMHMPFREWYWVAGTKSNVNLEVNGYNEFPFYVPRWDVVDDACYGYGPGWYALVESKTLQLMSEDVLVALEMVIKPPMVASTETVKKGINQIPGGVIISDDNNPNKHVMAAYQINPDFEKIEAKCEQIRQVIKRRFFADLFMMLDSLDKGQMTAREVIERAQEKMTLLGPATERFQFELLNPVIDRAFAIANRANLLPPPPLMLQGRDIKVEYISPLAQAQKMAGLSAIEQYMAFAGNLMAMGFMRVANRIDEIKVIDKYGDMLGVPQDLQRSDEEMAQIEEQQAQQQQAMQMAEMAKAAAPATAAAKNLATSPIEGNNALTALIGGPPGVSI